MITIIKNRISELMNKKVNSSNIENIEENKEQLKKGNVLVTGKTNSGKSVFLKSIVKQYLDSNSKIIIHDVKGDYVKKFYDEENWIILNPFDKERGYSFNIFETLEFEQDITRLCRILFPISKQPSEFILTGIIYTCLEKRTTTNADILKYLEMDYKQLINSISYVKNGISYVKNGEDFRKAYKGAETAFAVLNLSNAENLYYDFLSDITIFKNFISCEKVINIEDYITNDKRNLILANFVNNNMNVSIYTFFLDCLSRKILELQESKDISLVMILDDFHLLKKSHEILKLLTRSGEVTLFFAIQSLYCLKDIFNEEEQYIFSRHITNKIEETLLSKREENYGKDGVSVTVSYNTQIKAYIDSRPSEMDVIVKCFKNLENSILEIPHSIVAKNRIKSNLLMISTEFFNNVDLNNLERNKEIVSEMEKILVSTKEIHSKELIEETNSSLDNIKSIFKTIKEGV